MINMLKNQYLIINIDESSFGADLQFNYSWLEKGNSKPIWNGW